MPLLDLSQVTNSLASARLNITQRIDPSLAASLDVTTLPPERVRDAANTINLYLYHIAEDPYYRNLPGNLSDDNPASTKPMSLILFYILTTHHEVDSVFDSVVQQRLMGYALKTFHDFSTITDRSEINGTPLLNTDLHGRDNALETASPARAGGVDLVLVGRRPDDDPALRLLRGALRPARARAAQRLPGIVLRLGNFIVDIASPQLAGTRGQ